MVHGAMLSTALKRTKSLPSYSVPELLSNSLSIGNIL